MAKLPNIKDIMSIGSQKTPKPPLDNSTVHKLGRNESFDAIMSQLNDGDYIIKKGVQYRYYEGKIKRVGRGSRIIKRVEGADSYDEDMNPIYNEGSDYGLDESVDIANIAREIKKYFD